MHISCNHDLTILLSVAVHCSTSTQQLCSLTKCTLSACSTHCVFTCHGTITIAPRPPPPPPTFSLYDKSGEGLAQIIMCDNVGS